MSLLNRLMALNQFWLMILQGSLYLLDSGNTTVCYKNENLREKELYANNGLSWKEGKNVIILIMEPIREKNTTLHETCLV